VGQGGRSVSTPRARSGPLRSAETAGGHSPGLFRILPSGRSLLVSIAVLLFAASSYLVARETAIFSIDRVEVRGAAPRVADEVRATLTAVEGENLVGFDLARARLAVERLPSVAAVSFDRAFPHTLRIIVTPERAIAVIRQRAAAYLVSARGRIMRAVPRSAGRRLPRIWAPPQAVLEVGGYVDETVAPAVRTLVPADGSRFPARIRSVAGAADGLVLRLRSGLQVRLGEPADIRLKLAVAALVIPKLPEGAAYLDVSVPERPVAGHAPVSYAAPGVTEGLGSSGQTST
jgi:cell division protein FtsQ